MNGLSALGEGWRGRKTIYKCLQDSVSIRKDVWEELGAEQTVQAGKGCQEKTPEERSEMRAGIAPWLRPSSTPQIL